MRLSLLRRSLQSTVNKTEGVVQGVLPNVSTEIETDIVGGVILPHVSASQDGRSRTRASGTFRPKLDILTEGRSLSLDDVGELIGDLKRRVHAAASSSSSTSSSSTSSPAPDPRTIVRDLASFLRQIRQSQPSARAGWNEWRLFLLKSDLPKCVDYMVQYGALLSARDASTSYSMLRSMGLTTKAVQLEPILLERLPEMDAKAIAGVLSRSPSVHLQELFLARLPVDDCSGEMLLAIAKNCQNEKLVTALKRRGLAAPELPSQIGKNTPLQRSLDLISPHSIASYQNAKVLMNSFDETRLQHGDSEIRSDQVISLLVFLARGRPESKAKWVTVLHNFGVDKVFEVIDIPSLSARQLAQAYAVCVQLGWVERAEEFVPAIRDKIDVMKPAHRAEILRVAPIGPLCDTLLHKFAVGDISTGVLAKVAVNTCDGAVLQELSQRPDFADLDGKLRLASASAAHSANLSEVSHQMAQSLQAADMQLLDDENVLTAYALSPNFGWGEIRRRLAKPQPEQAEYWKPYVPDALTHRLQLAEAIKEHRETDCLSAFELDYFFVVCSKYINHKHKNKVDFSQDEMGDLGSLLDVQADGHDEQRGSGFAQFVRQYINLFRQRMEYPRTTTPDTRTRWTDMHKLAEVVQTLARAKRRCAQAFTAREGELRNLQAHCEVAFQELSAASMQLRGRVGLDLLSDIHTLCGHIDASLVREVWKASCVDEYSQRDLWLWGQFLQDDIPEELSARLTAESVQTLSFEETSAVLSSNMIKPCEAGDQGAIHALLVARLFELYNAAPENTLSLPALSSVSDYYILERLSPSAQLRYANSVECLRALSRVLQDSAEGQDAWYKALSVDSSEEAYLALRAIAVMEGNSACAKERIDAAFSTLLQEPNITHEQAAECVEYLMALPPEYARSVDMNILFARAMDSSATPTHGTWSWWNTIRIVSPTVYAVLERCFPALSLTMRSIPAAQATPAPRWLAEFVEKLHGSPVEQFPIPETPFVASFAIEAENQLIFVDSEQKLESVAVDKLLQAMGWTVQRKSEKQWFLESSKKR